MNFGKWIVVAFILFAGFIATLVIICVRQDISLVSKEYYQEELDYQKQIQRMNNTAHLANKPVIKIFNGTLTVEFNQPGEAGAGEVKLYCPSDPTMDRVFKVQSLNDPIQVFDLKALQKGMYKTKLLWTMNGIEYYQEDIIYI